MRSAWSRRACEPATIAIFPCGGPTSRPTSAPAVRPAAILSMPPYWSGRHLSKIGLDLVHKQVRAGRHDKGKAPGPAASELRCSYMRLKGIALYRLLDATDGVRPYAGPIVEHPVHGREAHSGLARDVLERKRCAVVLHSHRYTIAELLLGTQLILRDRASIVRH